VQVVKVVMWGDEMSRNEDLDQRRGYPEELVVSPLSCQPEHELLGTDPALDHVLEPVADLFEPTVP